MQLKAKQYFSLQQEVLDYFGEGQRPALKNYPLYNGFDWHWFVCGHFFVFSEKPFTKESITKGEIRSESLMRHVIRKDEMSLAFTCGNHSLLMIIDNAKECTDQEIYKLYEENWV